MERRNTIQRDITLQAVRSLNHANTNEITYVIQVILYMVALETMRLRTKFTRMSVRSIRGSAGGRFTAISTSLRRKARYAS